MSLPAWECGLKLIEGYAVLEHDAVTPCVGVWIEMYLELYSYSHYSSLPAWECGLKFWLVRSNITVVTVTPCVGVWIEITSRGIY